MIAETALVLQDANVLWTLWIKQKYEVILAKSSSSWLYPLYLSKVFVVFIFG